MGHRPHAAVGKRFIRYSRPGVLMRHGRLPLLEFCAAWFSPDGRRDRLISTEVSVVQRNADDWAGLASRDNDALANEDRPAYGDGSDAQDDDASPGDQLALGSGIHIAILRPRNFRDAITIGEYYRQGVPVIINLEDMDNALATRIIDFISGLILGLQGDVERPSRRTFLIVPAGVTIHTTHNGLTEEGFFNQALRPALAGVYGPSTTLEGVNGPSTPDRRARPISRLLRRRRTQARRSPPRCRGQAAPGTPIPA